MIVPNPDNIDFLQFSRNFPDLRVIGMIPPYPVVLKKDGVTVLDELYMNDDQNGFKLKFRELMHSLMSITTMYDAIQAVTDNNAIFTISLAGGTNEFEFKILKGGINQEGIGLEVDYAKNFCKSRYLSWQPAVREVSSLEHQYLSFYAVQPCTLRYITWPGAVYHQEVLETETSYRIHLAALQLPENVSSLVIWVEYSDESTSRTQTYNIAPAKSVTNDVFVFENSLGGFDTVEFTGALAEADDHDIQRAVINDETREYAADYKRQYRKNTGYIATEAERLWLRDFYSSLQKWHYVNGELKRIFLKSWDNETARGELNEQTFTFQYSREDGTNKI